MEKQVTSTPPPQYLEMGGGGGFWLPVFTLPAINVDMVNFFKKLIFAFLNPKIVK